jgi:predicted GIY-YIG superfamily endonuclease
VTELPIPDTKHVLYRFYDASGALLYVGITAKPIRRFRDHQKTKDWWTEVSSIRVENFSSRLELIYGERRAIVHEKPLYNITYNNHSEADAESLSAGARYTLEQATELICGDDSGLADPQLWMMRQLRKGRFHGFKIGRNWFMPQADVEAAIDSLRNGTKAASKPATDPVADPRIIDGLSERAKRRLRSV